RHHAGVLDPNPAQPDQVQTWLHGDHVALREKVVGRVPKGRLFVHFQPDAVAGAVVHLRDAVGTFVTRRLGTEAAVDQDLAYVEVRLFTGHARGDRFDAGVHGLQHGGVHPPDLFADLAHHHRARDVAAVVGATAGRKDVDDHRRVGLDRAFAAVVGQRALG